MRCSRSIHCSRSIQCIRLHRFITLQRFIALHRFITLQRFIALHRFNTLHRLKIHYIASIQYVSSIHSIALQRITPLHCIDSFHYIAAIHSVALQRFITLHRLQQTRHGTYTRRPCRRLLTHTKLSRADGDGDGDGDDARCHGGIEMRGITLGSFLLLLVHDFRSWRRRRRPRPLGLSPRACAPHASATSDDALPRRLRSAGVLFWILLARLDGDLPQPTTHEEVSAEPSRRNDGGHSHSDDCVVPQRRPKAERQLVWDSEPEAIHEQRLGASNSREETARWKAQVTHHSIVANTASARPLCTPPILRPGSIRLNSGLV